MRYDNKHIAVMIIDESKKQYNGMVIPMLDGDYIEYLEDTNEVVIETMMLKTKAKMHGGATIETAEDPDMFITVVLHMDKWLDQIGTPVPKQPLIKMHKQITRYDGAGIFVVGGEHCLLNSKITESSEEEITLNKVFQTISIDGSSFYLMGDTDLGLAVLYIGHGPLNSADIQNAINKYKPGTTHKVLLGKTDKFYRSVILNNASKTYPSVVCNDLVVLSKLE